MTEVGKGYEAEKAGIKPGDVILRWSRGEAKGEIESPFDLWWVESEQAPRGRVTLEGIRATEKHFWTLGPDKWSASVRPNFRQPLLSQYQAILHQSRSVWSSGDAPASTKAVRIAESCGVEWCRAWILTKVAGIFEKAKNWVAFDDLYGRAVEDRPLPPLVAVRIYSAWGYSYLTRRNSLTRRDESRADFCNHKALDILQQVHEETFAAADLVDLLEPSPSRLSLREIEERRARGLSMRKRLVAVSLPVALALDITGALAAYRGDLSMAEHYYEQSRAIVEEVDPGSSAAGLLYTGLGELERERGHLTKAEEYLRRALAIEQEHGESEESRIARTMTSLGLIALDQGDPQRAADYFSRVWPIAEHQGPLYTGVILIDWGLALEEQGDFNNAEDRFKRALRDLAAPSHKLLASEVTNDLGVLEWKRGKLVDAEKYLRQAMSVRQELAPDSLNLAWTLNHLGDVVRDKGSLSEAEDCYRRALAIRQKLAPESAQEAESLAALAGIAVRRRDLATAGDYYQKALSALESQTARLGGASEVRAGFRAQHEDYYRDFISVLLAQGKPALALETLERSRARTLLETLSSAHIDLAGGANPELLQRERAVQENLKAKSERRIRLLTEKHTDEQSYAASVKAIEKEISDLTAEYQDLEAQLRAASPAYSALTQPQPLSAREVQRQILDRNTLLLEYSLGEESSHVFAVTPDSLQVFELPKRSEIEKQARRVYGLLTARNKTLRGETAAQRERRLAGAEREYGRAAAGLSRMILAPVAAQLGAHFQNKRLLIVADGALHYIPFAALPEPAAPPETKAPITGQTAVRTPEKIAVLAASHIPLAVNHEIVNLPSASVLALLRQQAANRKPAPRAVAVLADPVFDKTDSRITGAPAREVKSALDRGATSVDPTEADPPSRTRERRRGSQDRGALPDVGQLNSSISLDLLTRSAADLGLSRNGELRLPRLRYTRREAYAILAVTPQGAGLEALDFNANRAAAMSRDLAQYRIVHFATHGLLNSEHPELSGLVLSLVNHKGKPQDGFLSLQDIYNMNLRADLVVLSACETGLGKQISGEGLIGLTRGFMYAGTPRVVASLWNVSDVATAQLMADFYRAMERDGLTPAAALREAQVRMWQEKRWRSPYYWAAFQIQGEWR